MFFIKAKLRNYIDRVVADAMPKVEEKPVPDAVEILFERQGYARTLATKLPVGVDGAPIPWYTYPAIEYFNQWDARNLRVFEYGSGHSSLYWSRRGAEVWSVEHDPEWYENMSARSAQLKGLYLRQTPEDYAAAITEPGGDFDVIIVDGVWRNACAKAALPFLRSGGAIILDNSDWYTDVSDHLKGEGFFQIDFNGFGPINNYCWTTSILFPFNSSLKDRIHQPKPVGGIEASKNDKW
ncbi:hypothetical protein [Rhizobium sp. SGZ-381]|uniref:hypothetical protein n=1 Tax=Rhizobium sp. SGZ-381 TaxID=3342800 RepID=UPI00366D9ACC